MGDQTFNLDAERLRRLRTAWGVQSQWVARHADLSRMEYSEIENGRRACDLTTGQAIADALGIELGEIDQQNNEVSA